jgi:hypothetical protein
MADPNLDPNIVDLNDPNAVTPLELPTYTVYVVGKLNETNNLSKTFFGNFGSEKGYVMGVSDVLADYAKFWTNGGGEMRSTGPIDDTDRYYLMVGTVTQTFDKKLIINDCVENEGSGGNGYGLTNVVSVGALGNGSQFLVGDIAEIRVYDGFIQATHEGIVNELVSTYGLDRECLGGPDPNTVALTALTFFGTTSGGQVRDEERWNTLWEDGAWDVVLTNDTIAELQAITLEPNDPFPDALNVVENMSIYQNLQKGQSYTYTWLNARNDMTAGLYFGMNFFFDSAQALGGSHGISVFANMTDPNEAPELFELDSATTMGWPITAVDGAGTLIYKDFDKGLSVTLTDWVVYHQDVYGLDLITAQSSGHPVTEGADGVLDVVGQFTLQVDSYTPTCDDLIALGGEYFFMDFNKDCYVNLEDFAQFAEDWLKCNDPGNVNCTDTP